MNNQTSESSSHSFQKPTWGASSVLSESLSGEPASCLGPSWWSRVEDVHLSSHLLDEVLCENLGVM